VSVGNVAKSQQKHPRVPILKAGAEIVGRLVRVS
jgi:hypothetical protein